ncbi:histidinol-phosphate aminotransferase family protein [Streptacidiphilus sp. PB12-B1b]|uniref:pyridoxal phosphate-dependent aminotransferase n=1 Tax=Streptacidiphilus sp. PB12-B1b TaxID=2705012 RepID=UPI0015F9FBBC|nr:histidinol-phosphate transaminase [Streptacidiphilus sp. PB12-B1b]QMU77046.1 histidinol-phosphate aminotransferase family protein [Streptacidiphilus sp. PB12-B1b]
MVAAHPSADEEALLDWNESPIGPPALAVKRVIDAAGRLHRYPRGLMEEVAALAAAHFGVAPGNVLLTAGVDEAIDITLSIAARAWGVKPGFDGYEDRVLANGKEFHPIPLGPDWQPTAAPDPAIGPDDIVYLAQPGNPTGNLHPAEWIAQVRAAAGHVFIDETYQEFCSGPSALRRRADRPWDPRLLVYRSFSKAAGLAGIRLGCLIGDQETIARLEPRRRFMPIDAVSLNAVAGLLEEPEFMDRLSAYVREARAGLTARLRASGLFEEVRPSEANFVLAKPYPQAADALAGQLRADLVRVKDCTVLGMPGWLRISVSSEDDRARFDASLDRVVQALPV